MRKGWSATGGGRDRHQRRRVVGDDAILSLNRRRTRVLEPLRSGRRDTQAKINDARHLDVADY